MPRVVPSQVVAFIDQVFPWLREGTGGALAREHAGEASALLQMLDNVPEELMTMTGRDYTDFVCGVAAIRERVELWRNHMDLRINTALGQMARGLNPVTFIRQVLSTCPDEGPAAATAAQISFIVDPELRANLQIDLGTVDRALSNGEWKAATVLAGSAIEALLLWDLQNRRQSTFPAAASALVANKTFRKLPPSSPEDWAMHHYIEVAAHLNVIKPDTATEARLAKDFRNLIHPGRAQRLGQICDRGTALSSAAAVHHVIRDLTP